MPRNYDSSTAGKPYVRAPKITIEYPEPLKATVKVEETLALKLFDGSVYKMQDLPELQFTVDLATTGNDPIPVVDPNTGAQVVVNGTPQYTTRMQTMLSILAALRAAQLAAFPD